MGRALAWIIALVIAAARRPYPRWTAEKPADLPDYNRAERRAARRRHR